MSDLDNKAKELLASVRASVKDVGVNLSNDRWTSSRLWIAIVGLVSIIILHRMGIADKIIDYTFLMAFGFMILRSITDLSVHFGNAKIECKKVEMNGLIEIERVRQGLDDGAPPINKSTSI